MMNANHIQAGLMALSPMSLHRGYNALLVTWAEAGYASPCECEACGRSLIGRDASDRNTCVGACESWDDGPSDESLRAAERRQMGIAG